MGVGHSTGFPRSFPELTHGSNAGTRFSGANALMSSGLKSAQCGSGNPSRGEQDEFSSRNADANKRRVLTALFTLVKAIACSQREQGVTLCNRMTDVVQHSRLRI